MDKIFEDFNWSGCDFPDGYIRSIFYLSKREKFDGKCLEVGFDSGSSALAFLRGSPEATLLSVDVGECLHGRDLIERSEVKDRHTFVQADSREYLKTLTEKFSFIYIDGDHLYDVVKQDLVNAASLLKEGGIMLVDDCEENHQHFGVAKAVNEFINEFGFSKESLYGSPNSAVILKKI